MRQTQVLLVLFLAGRAVEGDEVMDGLLQLSRVMQLEPQIDKAKAVTLPSSENAKRQVQGAQQQVNYAGSRHEPVQFYIFQPMQYSAQTHRYQVDGGQQQVQQQYQMAPQTYQIPQNYYQGPVQNYQMQPQGYQTPIQLFVQPREMAYPSQHIQLQNQVEPAKHQIQYIQLIPYPHYHNQNLQLEEQETLAKQKAYSEAIQQKYVQQILFDQSNQIMNKYQQSENVNYIPVEVLINNLAEPLKMIYQGQRNYGKQPTMPVYHYVPVPKGTFQDSGGESDGRIKESKPGEAPTDEVGYQTQTDVGYQTQTDVGFQTQTDIDEELNLKDDPKESAINDLSEEAKTEMTDGDDYSAYDFGYRITDNDRGVEMGKMESKEKGVTRGSYHVLLPDGRLQIVKYWSDHTGYHTDISYRGKP